MKLITVHTGDGSMAEAMEPIAAALVADSIAEEVESKAQDALNDTGTDGLVLTHTLDGPQHLTVADAVHALMLQADR